MANNVPNDITKIILLCLPDESLYRFKAVCKSWCSLIEDRLDDPVFIKQRYYYEIFLTLWENRYGPQIEPAPTIFHSLYRRLLDSCQGLLVLAFVYSPDNIVLWNPDVKESRTIPFPIRGTRMITLGECTYSVGSGKNGHGIRDDKKVKLAVSSIKTNGVVTKMLEITELGPEHGSIWFKKGSRKKGSGGHMLYLRMDKNKYVVYDSKSQEFNEVDEREESRIEEEFIVEEPNHALLFADPTYLESILSPNSIWDTTY